LNPENRNTVPDMWLWAFGLVSPSKAAATAMTAAAQKRSSAEPEYTGVHTSLKRSPSRKAGGLVSSCVCQFLGKVEKLTAGEQRVELCLAITGGATMSARWDPETKAHMLHLAAVA
jgi:hypothetical protein